MQQTAHSWLYSTHSTFYNPGKICCNGTKSKLKITIKMFNFYTMCICKITCKLTNYLVSAGIFCGDFIPQESGLLRTALNLRAVLSGFKITSTNAKMLITWQAGF